MVGSEHPCAPEEQLGHHHTPRRRIQQKSPRRVIVRPVHAPGQVVEGNAELRVSLSEDHTKT
eukprot:1571133-Pleurochrysis_carterae.AAC.1